ncbi:sn-glycerol-3-phosphate ABC transporter permease UgpA [Nitratireductor aquimarinus]|uniref:sn-glycerol-3-phosphate transport system permease protein UgpA n=1 Tax=Nitratireductor aquimarinus TaxID=889300 RepID=A0ABU4APV4_9HYPH|nr:MULTISPECIES: sn-glycerol-3-phosphate ABC transporter permease UgpA [Nitratireductor]MBN8245424.1 sn-glycerol-3-phosphate ABC transporter permease UgpA [Nitratireductor aquimarinus]MBY6133809.1 sn-glycerol-3-phosphate ABC transporter permease UgpA [Nitratireductor aquimarinus]MCA1304896.1 sn-glycerol-3-phosphate ABC transporter permease UgpA [Nitratireductor aquimarinus]MCV0349647.1 sn-glycerol-3-phosphate ABC transporter permease UgpA [Nitratireductor sp.]MDJ1465231.1 sn-glycerol-3-phospha
MEKRVTFDNRLLPYLLLAPQLLVTIVFFFWPAAQALYQSLLLPDPFGLGAQFVWFSNFEYLFSDPYYLKSFITTAVFTFFVTVVSMSVALLFAVMADQVIKGAGTYKTLLIWPYAVAPAVAGVMWLFMFQPSIGVIAFYMKAIGIDWNPVLNGGQAMSLVILAAAWKQISYNFLFFLAGLQAIPKSLIEAAAIDGAGKWHRFRTIIFPLLSPTTFFLLVVNIVYAFFETFGIIHTMTAGGPGQSTTILVYKVYSDGFVGQDLGSSAAQSVILMVVVGILTVIQFRFIERRVHY